MGKCLMYPVALALAGVCPDIRSCVRDCPFRRPVVVQIPLVGFPVRARRFGRRYSVKKRP